MTKLGHFSLSIGSRCFFIRDLFVVFQNLQLDWCSIYLRLTCLTTISRWEISQFQGMSWAVWGPKSLILFQRLGEFYRCEFFLFFYYLKGRNHPDHQSQGWEFVLDLHCLFAQLCLRNRLEWTSDWLRECTKVQSLRSCSSQSQTKSLASRHVFNHEPYYFYCLSQK